MRRARRPWAFAAAVFRPPRSSNPSVVFTKVTTEAELTAASASACSGAKPSHSPAASVEPAVLARAEAPAPRTPIAPAAVDGEAPALAIGALSGAASSVRQ